MAGSCAYPQHDGCTLNVYISLHLESFFTPKSHWNEMSGVREVSNFGIVLACTFSGGWNICLTLTRLLRFFGSSSSISNSISRSCCLIWTISDWMDSSKFMTVLHILSSSFWRSFEATIINSIRPFTLEISSWKTTQHREILNFSNVLIYFFKGELWQKYISWTTEPNLPWVSESFYTCFRFRLSLKKWHARKVFSCLRSSGEDMSADEAPCRTREKTAGTEGKPNLAFSKTIMRFPRPIQKKKTALWIENSYG